MKKGTFGKFPLWHVVQAFKSEKGTRLPTVAEYRSMVWTAIANGSNGIVFWVLGDRVGLAAEKANGVKFEEAWADITKVIGEIRKAEPVLISEPGPAPKVLPEGATVRTFVYDGHLRVLAVETKGEARVLSLDFDGYGVREIELRPWGVYFK